MRDHLDEVALVNQLAADRAVSEMVDLLPVQIIHVDASVARQLLRAFDVRLKSLGKDPAQWTHRIDCRPGVALRQE